MCHILLKNTVYRRGSEEHDIRAEVVFALTAELAVTAGLARLQRNAVADFQMLDSTANSTTVPPGSWPSTNGGLTT